MRVSVVFVCALMGLSLPAWAQDTARDEAESILKTSCGTCHVQGDSELVLVDKKGEVIWDTVEARAEDIIEMVSSGRMPPRFAPPSAHITPEQRATLVSYVAGLKAGEEPQPTEQGLDLKSLELPKGFSIEVVAQAPGARSMAVHSSGVVFVGTGSPTAAVTPDTVYALIPRAKKGFQTVVFAAGLNAPNGVALHGDDLYVAEATRVIVYRNAVQTALQRGQGVPENARYEVIRDGFAEQDNHYWKYLGIGPDNKLYVPIGADCNVCLPENREGTAGIFRMNLDGSDYELVAKGVRNTVGFDWDPAAGELWFTDNGRDWLGDDAPSDELNRLESVGQDFGFPYCYGSDVSDPEFGTQVDCASPRFVKPVEELGAHVAALGMTFYRGALFPKAYHNSIFIAEHGSWNRSEKSGYRVRVVSRSQLPGGLDTVTVESFVQGWLDEETQENWGRPVDVKNYIDGSLLISDDYAGVVYKVHPSAP